MERRDLAPATRAGGLPLGSEKAAVAKAPAGVQFATDHGLRHHADEPDHSIAKPVMSTAVPTHKRNPGMRGERDRTFFSSDDNALSKQIVATHAPDFEDLEVRPVLSIVENILHLAKPQGFAETALMPQTPLHKDKLDDKGVYPRQHDGSRVHTPYHDDTKVHAPYRDDKVHASYRDDKLHSSYPDERLFRGPEHDAEIVKVLAYPINKISCEIICKCAAGGESHSVTMELLRSLTSYAWDAKVVIAFAAFAVNYGEFWLVEHFHTKDPLAKNIAILKDLPDIMANAGELKKKFDAVLELLNSALQVAHCIIAFKELPPMYISRESPEITAATAHIPTAVYWIIRSLLVCSFTLLSMIGSSMESITSTSESWEILSLNHKLQVIMEHLQNQLGICSRLVEKKKEEDAYALFVKIMNTSHIDNMKVLRAMIRSKEDQRPLFDGTKKTTERLEVLRMKYVLLLISDLDLPHEELNVLHLIYNQQAMRHEYEVLWLPIIPDTLTETFQDNAFYELRNTTNMPWLSVEHPSLVEHVARRYIREVWKFVHTPMLVVLDPQGRPSNLNALPMMWIWGSTAFPFTQARESALWSESSWNIELLADAIDPRLTDWIRDDKVICLYGGEDIEWIRRFTLAARSVARDLNVNMEMLYVGKRNPKDKVRRCHDVIVRENLSHVFSVTEFYDYIWYFWVRLTSMWNSKSHIGGMAPENDMIMREIKDVLTFDSSDQGWAVFSRGNYEITKANGEKLLSVLDKSQNWGYLVDEPRKFVEVLDEQLRGEHPEHHCNRLILPGQAGYIPERVVCSECGKTMDKYVMYRCCTD